VIRDQGMPFNTLPSGEIANQVRLRITNRTGEARDYTFGAEGVEFRTEANPIRVEPGETTSERALVLMPREFFAGTDGRRVVQITVSDDRGVVKTVNYKLVGPVNEAAPAPAGEQEVDG
jgi:hypothetical protein